MALDETTPRPGDTDNKLLQKILRQLIVGGIGGGGGSVTAGQGIIVSGDTVSFAQSGPYTTGAIPFATSPTTMGFDPENLFWDNANNRLGLGTDTPSHALSIGSAGVPPGIAIYNTADETTNFERGILEWNDNQLRLNTVFGGTGVSRTISIGPNSLTGSSGTEIGVQIQGEINQSGTSGFTYFLVNPTLTSAGSGTGLISDFQISGASKFNIGKSGIFTFNIPAGAGGVVNTSAASDARIEFKRVGVRQGNLGWDTGSIALGGDAAVGLTAGTFATITTAFVERLRITSTGNIGLNTPDQFGSGTKVIGLANATVAPTTNPTGGGVLYSEAGILKWRSSDGSTTLIAPSNQLSLNGDAFTIVGGSSSPATNATSLINAYTAAEAATPHGAAKSATNRFTIYLLPGIYTITAGAFVMDTQFIDIVGFGQDPSEVRLESTGKTVDQTADDVIIRNLTIFSSVASPVTENDPTAYFPASGLANTKCFKVYFRATNSRAAMRQGISYAGFYEDCICDAAGGFGTTIGAVTGVASGTFIRCLANSSAFGATLSGTNTASASGQFYDCRCSGGGFGMHGGASSGVFVNCSAGRGVFTPIGTFGVTAQPAFGAGSSTGAASGTFVNCESIGGAGFGAATAGSGSFTGSAWGCKAEGAGFGAGSSGGSFGGTASFCRHTGVSVGWTTFSGTIARCDFPNWGEIYTPNTADSTAISNTVAETDFSVNKTVRANSWKAEKVLQFRINGKYSSDAVTPGTLILRVKLGTTVMATSKTFNLPASATNIGWAIEGSITCRSIGGAGTTSSEAIFSLEDNIIGAIGITPSNGTKTVNTTVNQTFQVSAQFSVADVDNSITLENLHLVPIYTAQN